MPSVVGEITQEVGDIVLVVVHWHWPCSYGC